MKVKNVVPLLPSGCTADSAATDTDASSLRIVPVADAVPIVSPAQGELSVTMKLSSGSTIGSPRTSIASVLLVSPGAKVRTPPLSALAAKSAALAGFMPEPATDQATV